MLHAAVLAAIACAAAGCEGDLDPRSPAHVRSAAGGHARNAPKLMREYGCISCHTIPGVRGAHALVGPSLAGFASRQYIAGRVANEPDALVRWIMHPQSVKPGTAMPEMGVTGQHARDMAAYLYTLE